MNELVHDMSLIGMKVIKPLDIYYFEELPQNFVRCSDINDFFKLKKGKRIRNKENLETVIDMEYLVYSPTSNLYYYKTVHEYTNMWNLLKYIKDKNVFTYTEVKRLEKIREREPEYTEVLSDTLIY